MSAIKRLLASELRRRNGSAGISSNDLFVRNTGVNRFNGVVGDNTVILKSPTLSGGVTLNG